MKPMLKNHTWIPLSSLALALGCASSEPSTQLRDARQAYQDARMSHANQYVPSRLHEAKQALDKAERAHQDDPDSYRERSLAYVAYRKSELAMSEGAKANAEQTAANAEALAEKRRRHMLTTANQQLQQQKNQLSEQEGELQRERNARLEAERRAQAAIASLRELAQVKEEARRTIITIDGAVLFKTGESELMPIAENKLEGVAKSIQDMGSEGDILIVGHTDSRGTVENNMELSRERANSVRDYLIKMGISAERVRAEGRGESQPIATNDTAEGRANNRRVEIIVNRGSSQERPQGNRNQ